MFWPNLSETKPSQSVILSGLTWQTSIARTYSSGESLGLPRLTSTGRTRSGRPRGDDADRPRLSETTRGRAGPTHEGTGCLGRGDTPTLSKHRPWQILRDQQRQHRPFNSLYREFLWWKYIKEFRAEIYSFLKFSVLSLKNPFKSLYSRSIMISGGGDRE